jgi:hypothetical protein
MAEVKRGPFREVLHLFVGLTVVLGAAALLGAGFNNLTKP